jgi:prephenate dehydrogenase
MGRWFAAFLVKEGQEVILTGRNQQRLLEAGQQLGVETATSMEAVRDADVVMISVPIDSFEEVVQQLQPHLHSEQIIIDITSVKERPVEIMHRYINTGTVLGTHPVFGPGAKDVRNQNFVLTPINDKETALAQKIKQYLEERGARVTLMTPGEHDELMAVILGLSHFIAIVSADALLGLNKINEAKAIGGTTYKVLLTLVESVISEDPELYASLQMNLPSLTEVEELFLSSSKTWADIVKNKDRQAFVNRMTALKDKLEKIDPDFNKAYENMYRLLDR